MAKKIIRLEEKIKEKNIPVYGECACGCDTWLLHLNPDTTERIDVIALECTRCREVAPLENNFEIFCELE